MNAHVSPAQRPVRLLLSGGGNRAALGSVGVILYLMVRGRWPAVNEVVSVSGSSVTNAALLTLDGDDDAARLRTLTDNLVRDGARPWATGRRMLVVVALLALVVGLVAGVLWIGGVVPAGSEPRPLLIALAALVAVPLLLQLGRRLGSRYLRDVIETTTGSRDRTFAELHDPGAGRQHVFCASGFSSGAPYYFWAGGEAFLAVDGHGPGSDPDDIGHGWGAPIDPDRSPVYTVGDAAFASSSLPFLGGVTSPVAEVDAERGVFPTVAEPLVDGGASGVFGQQVRDPFWKPPGTEARRGGADEVPLVVAVDAYRHLEAGSGGFGSKIVTFVRDRLSVISMLVTWIKISGEALYVNDLLDTEGVTLVRVCAADLPDRWSRPTVESDWRAAWDEVCAERQKRHAVTVAADGGRSVEDRLGDLRTQTAKLGLLNLNSARAVNAITTGFVGTYVNAERSFDEAELRELLARAGATLFGAGDPRANALRDRWIETEVAP